MSDSLASQLADLARHMVWADAKVWDSVLATPAARDDDKLAETLHHIHLVQHIFTQGWERTPFKVAERGEFATLEDLRRWGRQAHQGVASFLDRVHPGQLSELCRVPWAAHFEQQSGQPAGVHTLGESVLQVILHTQHHRGQVCARLRQIGGEPPTVDLIVWFWAGRPEATLEL